MAILERINDVGTAAIAGENENTDKRSIAVIGTSTGGAGVRGRSQTHIGVHGTSESDTGVFGHSGQGKGVHGRSESDTGMFGESSQGKGVHGRGPTGGFFEGGSRAGVHAVHLNNGAAGFFEGNVEVTKTITAFDILITGADCAEDFDILSSAHVDPGTVMVIGDDARLVESHRAYDKRVAGIVSGAGDYKPGITLGKDASRKDRVPLALVGRAFCKVDATHAPIEVGDLLTTSPTQGHAMKAEHPLKAFGAVVGKALAPLRDGRGLLPVLIALH